MIMLQSCFLSSLSSDFVFQVCEDGRDREKMRLWEIEEILNLPFFLLFVQRSPFGIALMSCLRGCLSVRGCLSICEKARNPQPALLPPPLTEIFFWDSSQQMQIFNLLKLTHQAIQKKEIKTFIQLTQLLNSIKRIFGAGGIRSTRTSSF